MRGSAPAQAVYRTEASVGERAISVLELNANTGIGYQYAGYYFGIMPNPKPPGTTGDSTAGGAGIVNTFSTYVNASETKVTGTAFTTGIARVNREIVNGSTMTNIPSLSYVDEPDLRYEEFFSIVNCLKANRPDPGIVRMAASGANQFVPSSRGRMYPASKEHNFKYWRAYDLNSANPFVYYSRDFKTNKIKISVQNHMGVPRNYKVQVLPAGSTTWTDVWTQASGAFPTTGVFKIYYYDGAWTTVPRTDKIHNLSSAVVTNAVSIRGLRLVVTSMNSFFSGYVTPNATTQTPPANTVPLDIFPSVVQNDAVPLELIELSARMALDVTDSIKEFDTVHSLSEEDSALPVGSIIANDANVELENFDGVLSFRDVLSPFYGWEPKKSSVDLYFLTQLDAVTSETNRIFMGTIIDTNASGGNLTISAQDNSSVLQGTRVNNFVTLNKTVTSIIMLLLDHAGVSGFIGHFSNVTQPVTTDFNNAENPMIRYYHAHDQTVFEAIADLAEAYQFSVSFDSDNVMHLYSKEFMFDRDAAASSELVYLDAGSTLANIKSMEVTPGKPINDIVIAYDQKFIRKTPSLSSLGQPMWEALLEPQKSPAWEADSEYLAAAPLVKTLDTTQGVASDGIVTLDQEGGDGLRYKGYLLIDGEVIEYNAKQFQMKIGSSYTTKWITSEAEYNYWRDRTTTGGRMFFTGVLRIPKGGRAKFASTIQAHTVETRGEWPYNTAFNSYKFQSQLKTTKRISATGEYTWNYYGGTVFSVRGSLADSNAPTRNGSESCIRMTNASENEFANYGNTLLNPVAASTRAGHGYLGPTPLKTDGTRVVPKRVGAGVRILGRVDGSRKSISALGTIGAGGVGMYMRFDRSDSAIAGFGGMSGWYLEVRATVEVPTENMILWELVGSEWYARKKVTRLIEVWPPDQNTSTDTTDRSWNHLDLAFFPVSGAKPAAFVGYLNGKAVLSYNPTTTVTTSAWYGPVVRGDSYMDVDYTWWSDRSDPNDIDGFGLSNDSDPSDYTLEDVIDGAGGPTMWWENGAETIFKKGSNADQTNTFGINEFGPIAHAISVREVEFDDGPYLNPTIATTNNAEYIIPEFDLGPFGGRLVMVNARRRAVSVAGDAAPLSIVGYKVESLESEYTLDQHIRSGQQNSGSLGSAAEVKVAASRAIHGYIPVELQTDLIQDEPTAINILDWMVDYCTMDCDTVSAEVFGNPLLEPGDIVSITHPDHSYGASTRFVIMRVDSKWNQGLETSLLLRRIA